MAELVHSTVIPIQKRLIYPYIYRIIHNRSKNTLKWSSDFRAGKCKLQVVAKQMLIVRSIAIEIVKYIWCSSHPQMTGVWSTVYQGEKISAFSSSVTDEIIVILRVSVILHREKVFFGVLDRCKNYRFDYNLYYQTQNNKDVVCKIFIL